MRDIKGAQVYVVICSDTHSDDEVSVYAERKAAVLRATEHALDAMRHYGGGDLDHGLTDAMERAGWLYYARIGETCSVRVETREVK